MDETGKRTLLLPGEVAPLDRDIQRQRTAEYYKQIRGRYDPGRAIAQAELKKVRALLADSDRNSQPSSTDTPKTRLYPYNYKRY